MVLSTITTRTKATTTNNSKLFQMIGLIDDSFLLFIFYLCARVIKSMLNMGFELITRTVKIIRLIFLLLSSYAPVYTTNRTAHNSRNCFMNAESVYGHIINMYELWLALAMYVSSMSIISLCVIWDKDKMYFVNATSIKLPLYYGISLCHLSFPKARIIKSRRAPYPLDYC